MEMRKYQIGVIDETFSTILAYFEKGNYVISLADVEAVEELVKSDRSLSIREHVQAYANTNNLPNFHSATKTE